MASHLKSQTQGGERQMYKEAIIYYPKDEKIRKQIQKNVARFHCDAAIQYLDSLNFTTYQKLAVFESALECIRQSNPDLVVSDTSPSDKTLHHLHCASDEKEVAKRHLPRHKA